MSTSRSIISYSSSSLHLQPQQRYQPSFLVPNTFSDVSACNYQQGFMTIHGLFRLSIGRRRAHSKTNSKMYMAVQNSVQPGAPVPSRTPSHSWKGWIMGMLLSMVLPFWKHKLGPLLALKNEVDMVVETVECVVDVVEMVAEEVEKVADEVADQLPESGKLRGAVCFVESLAKETAKDAHLAQDLIHKVEVVEKEGESFIAPVMDQLNEVAKEASEPK